MLCESEKQSFGADHEVGGEEANRDRAAERRGARYLRMYLDPGFLSTKLPNEDQREIGEAVSAWRKRRLILVGKSKFPTHDGKVRYEVWECPGPLKQYR